MYARQRLKGLRWVLCARSCTGLLGGWVGDWQSGSCVFHSSAPGLVKTWTGTVFGNRLRTVPSVHPLGWRSLGPDPRWGVI